MIPSWLRVPHGRYREWLRMWDDICERYRQDVKNEFWRRVWTRA